MKKPDNLILVIFGATGDLTSRKLIPAIYSLQKQDLLPERFELIGLGRTEITSDIFRQMMEEAIVNYSGEEVDSKENVQKFLANISYRKIAYDNQEDYRNLGTFISQRCSTLDIGNNLIFYMATPPSLYELIAGNLASAGLTKQDSGFRRLIIEKPFGYDLESGIKLNNTLHRLITEDQIYRIDHYLGKETVQNLLVTRFANGIFEPLWNRNYIHRVEITSAESIGVEDRGSY
ncbi:MAG TPA: glucose-6-phosphate dehydrogenase, partial [Bacteroidales bacterium]|nr:glucose-6-phosphate dehydrogenase [Bacteroidales bacterium]